MDDDGLPALGDAVPYSKRGSKSRVLRALAATLLDVIADSSEATSYHQRCVVFLPQCQIASRASDVGKACGIHGAPLPKLMTNRQTTGAHWSGAWNHEAEPRDLLLYHTLPTVQAPLSYNSEAGKRKQVCSNHNTCPSIISLASALLSSLLRPCPDLAWRQWVLSCSCDHLVLTSDACLCFCRSCLP